VQSLQEPFVEQLKDPRAVVNRWSHLLSAQYDYETVEARMQFFAGPQLRPLVWRVNIGPSPSRIVGTYAKGFHFVYYDEPDRSGYIGEMTQLKSARQAVTGNILVRTFVAPIQNLISRVFPTNKPLW
jgi:hypothetical protein